MDKVYEQLREHVFSLDIIDTHEHLPAREQWRNQACDVLGEYLVHYMNCDLVSAGLRREQLAAVTDSSRPLMQRWELIEPYWQAARNTGYALAGGGGGGRGLTKENPLRQNQSIGHRSAPDWQSALGRIR